MIAMSDEQVIADGLARAKDQGEEIDDLTARVIAASWHGGQSSPLYALASSGAIVANVGDEITACKVDAYHQGAGTPELVALMAYVQHHGERGPQAGWSELRW
jgi:hypothetical protein